MQLRVYISMCVIDFRPATMYCTFFFKNAYFNLDWILNFCLNLNVRRLSYLGLTRSISWLLMPWLLTSPEPWYWLCRIGRFLSYLMKDFNYMPRINVEKWCKMKIYVYVPFEKFSKWTVNFVHMCECVDLESVPKNQITKKVLYNVTRVLGHFHLM